MPREEKTEAYRRLIDDYKRSKRKKNQFDTPISRAFESRFPGETLEEEDIEEEVETPEEEEFDLYALSPIAQQMSERFTEEPEEEVVPTPAQAGFGLRPSPAPEPEPEDDMRGTRAERERRGRFGMGGPETNVINESFRIKNDGPLYNPDRPIENDGRDEAEKSLLLKLGLMGGPEEDERSRRLKNLAQQYLYSVSPQQAQQATEAQNQAAMLGALSRAQSKIGTVGGKEAGSGLEPVRFGVQRPQLNERLLQMLLKKPYQGMDPRLGLAIEKFLSGKEERKAAREQAEKKFQYQVGRDVTARESKSQERIQRDARDFGKSASAAQSGLKAINQVEEILGHDLDTLQYDIDRDRIYDPAGQDVEPPGYNVPGYGRAAPLSPRGKELNSALQAVYNAHIKAVAGSAVTGPEMERIMNQFGSGALNTESQMLKALQRYKELLNFNLGQIRAKYPQEAIDWYESRGGFTGRTPLKTREQREQREQPAQQRPQRSEPREQRGTIPMRKKSTGEIYDVPPTSEVFQRMLTDPDFEAVPAEDPAYNQGGR